MPAQDSKLVIRCRYRALGFGFRPMAAHKDGRFVCEKCGRTVHPEEAAYLLLLPLPQAERLSAW